MDKRTVYGYWFNDRNGPIRFMCGSVDRCSPYEAVFTCGMSHLCQEHVLTDPAELAKVEQDARVGRAVEKWLSAQAKEK